MDANKLEKLKEIGYQVKKVCGLCNHSEFEVGSEWGVCKIYTYEHKKHADSKRELSINKMGGCPSFEANPDQLVVLHGFAPLVEP